MRYDTECSIIAAVEAIRSEICEIRDSGLSCTADVIKGALDDITSAVDCDNDADSQDEVAEFSTLIPETMSAGDADSLKQLILDWRKERGYGTPS